MTKAILVTAADDQYFTLAADWLASIRMLEFVVSPDLAMLDVGLSAQNSDFFRSNGVHVVAVGSDIEYPGRSVWEKEKPGLRTLTARPSLRRYFPGYDVYVWIDSDIWLQTPDAVDTLVKSAAVSSAIHLSCELDRCYSTFFQHAAIWQVFRNWYQETFGDEVAAAMTLKPMLNAGVFAMSKDSPVWDAWHAIYKESLQRLATPTDKGFMADQLGLNLLIYQKKVPAVIMPVLYNWLTFYALPKYDTATGLYVEPLPPHRAISQIHLTQKTKVQIEKIQTLDGYILNVPLTFSGRPKK